MKDEMKAMAKEAGKEGAKECMRSLGIDVDNIPEAQKNFLHLTKIRKREEFVSMRAIAVIITIVIPAFVYAAIEGIKTTFFGG